MNSLLQNVVTGSKKELAGKNYYYIQKRYSRYYYCKKCNELFGIYYRGKWDFGKYQHRIKDHKTNKIDFVDETDRFFPAECPNCCIAFIDHYDYLLREGNKRGCHG